MSVVTSSNTSAFQAAEFLDAYVGQEAAQVPNIKPYVYEVDLVGKKTTVAHLRSLNPFATSTGVGANEGGALPILAWSPSEQLVDSAYYGFQVQESKVMQSIDPEVLPDIAMQCASTLGREWDVALSALFPSLTAGTIGSSGVALTVAQILQGEANLYAQHADIAGAFTGIVAPQAFLDLQNDMISKNYGISKVNVDGNNKEFIEIGSTRIYRNTLVPTETSGANYAGGMFTRQALAIAIAANPKVEVVAIGGSAAWSIETTMHFGVSVWRPLFGCYILSGVSA
jgi:hypothetical protein